MNLMRIVLASVLCTVATGCAPADSRTPPRLAPTMSTSAPATASAPASTRHQGPGRVSDIRRGFSIVPPAGFASAGESIDHFLNFRGPEEGTLTVNFNISLQKDDGSPIEVAPRRVRQIMRLLLTNYAHLEEGQTVIDGKKCYYCSATFDWKGQRCRNLQYYLRGGNGMLYIITFASLEATFGKYRTDFERAALTARTD